MDYTKIFHDKTAFSREYIFYLGLLMIEESKDKAKTN